MSMYGRLWEGVSEIRRRIRERCPSANTNTLAEARRTVKAAGQEEELGHLLSEWAEYERHMARCD